MNRQGFKPYGEVVMVKDGYKRGKIGQWTILEKETIDEIIFRNTKPRNRIMPELMAEGGMQIGEVLKLTPDDIDDQKLIIRKPKPSSPLQTIPTEFYRNDSQT